MLKKILVVEDEVATLKMLGHFLSMKNLDVHTAQDGLEALELMKEMTPDAILLDVDNGPDGLTRLGNDQLYSMRGLAAAKAALASKGLLAIWSAGADAAFSRRLKDAGFVVEEVRVRARSNGKGPHHVIWFARKL